MTARSTRLILIKLWKQNAREGYPAGIVSLATILKTIVPCRVNAGPAADRPQAAARQTARQGQAALHPVH